MIYDSVSNKNVENDEKLASEDISGKNCTFHIGCISFNHWTLKCTF